jgi:hypothetical protein
MKFVAGSIYVAFKGEALYVTSDAPPFQRLYPPIKNYCDIKTGKEYPHVSQLRPKFDRLNLEGRKIIT